MPIIEAIHATPYPVDLSRSLAWGKNQALHALDHVLVSVALSDGSQGYAEATPRPTIYGETQTSILHIITEYLAPLLIGQTVNHVTDIHQLAGRMQVIKHNHCARGAVDMALYTALAQSQGVTLADVLDVKQDAVRVSAIIGTGTPDTVLDDVAALYADGVRVFKVKVGKNFDQERATIAQIRQTWPDADVYIDVNQCYVLEHEHKPNCITPVAEPRPTDARDYLQAFAELGVLWCEEPLPVGMVKDRAELRRMEILPLIGDDSCFTADDFSREVTLKTIDIVNIKTARNGFSEASHIHTVAQCLDIGVMVGSQASSLLGCLHAVIFSARQDIDYPAEASFYLKTATRDNAPPIVDGAIRIQDAVNVLGTFSLTL